jgi:hypothetical protein
MKSKIISFAVTSVIATLLTSPLARAQACPSDTMNPLSVLTGVWTFDMDGWQPIGIPFAAAGQFVASVNTVNGVQVGSLVIKQSSSVVRLEKDIGTYQIFPDCSGGTLIFTVSSQPLAFDFWFDESFGEIRFVSARAGAVIRGSAERF